MTSRAGFGLGIALAALASGLVATQGFALTFNVDTTADGPDANPGDGICATLVGPCTLRAAIEEANALTGAHTINLPYGIYAGAYVITADISLVGHRGGSFNLTPFVEGGGPTFTIESGARASMTDVSIINGDSTGTTGFGGCVENHGELEFMNGGLGGCTGVLGGAILNDGTLTMTSSVVATSDAVDVVTGGQGGGLFNEGTAILTEVKFQLNSSEHQGGAISNLANLSLTDCWLDDNEAASQGGGLYSNPLHPGDEVNLTRVTVSRNVSAGSFNFDGGGIHAQGNLTLTNVTIHSNSAGGTGGGLYLEDGLFGLVNVTIHNNSDGLATGDNATVQVVNTLFANTPSTNCSLLLSPITSFGHNLEAVSDTCGLNGPGDLTSSSLYYSTPGLYGGFGETMPLRALSPGIDDGDHALAPLTDQRRVPRMDGDGDGTVTADIGAYEYDGIFADGFESSSTSGWSSTVP